MSNRLVVSIVAFIFWTAITVVGGRMQSKGEGSLDDGVSHTLGWQFVAASAFILAVVVWQRWRDVGLCKPTQPGNLWLAWLPLLYIVCGFLVTCLLGLPPISVLCWVFINTCFVGFSEELMFRGVLMQAFRRSVSIWQAVLLMSLIFGVIHSLNVFTTGNLKNSLIQSAAAFLSGLFFIALRLRTGSLWPSIILHGLWDFAVFALAVAAKSGPDVGSAGTAGPTGIQIYFPILFVLPNALYGLWLMRNIGKTHTNADS